MGNQKYTQEFRESAVKLVLDQKQTVAAAAASLGMPHNTLVAWVIQARKGSGAFAPQGEKDLAARVRELEVALAQVKQLQGLLPICSYCKKVRDDKNYWQQVESYISQHTEVKFSHGICPDCWKRVLRPQLQQMGQDPPELPPS